jgi:hypothetical protein
MIARVPLFAIPRRYPGFINPALQTRDNSKIGPEREQARSGVTEPSSRVNVDGTSLDYGGRMDRHERHRRRPSRSKRMRRGR